MPGTPKVTLSIRDLVHSYADSRPPSTVVFITSNYVGNSELMQGCKEAGIPAFGTLWDFVSVIVLSSLLPLDDRSRSERRLERRSAGILLYFTYARCHIPTLDG
jgi:hypothetical protein